MKPPDIKKHLEELKARERHLEDVVLERTEEWRECEQQFKTMFENFPLALAYLDGDYKFLSVNRMFCEVMGFSEDELVGKHCYEIVGEYARDPGKKGREKICSFCRKDFGRRKSVVFERPVRERFLRITIMPEFDGEGNVVRYLEVGEDVSERRKVEEAHRVLEERLRHAQKLEAIGHLAGGIAHDFNNILTAVVSYGNILRMKMKKGDPNESYVNSILSVAERAAGLTQSLLTFSRKQPLSPRPVSVNRVLKGVEKLLSRFIGEDIEIRVAISSDELTVMADVSQIEQVLINLATNARDAMPDGGILTISGESARLNALDQGGGIEEKGFALISFSDSGVGMDRGTLDNIFEPFFTTKEAGKGTGLGLSTAFGIIKQHGGEIIVESETGRGTKFKIYLPLIEPGVRQEAALEASSLPGGRGQVILLAEDDPDVREVIKRILEEFGYSVIEAEDGEEAVRIFSDSKDSIGLLLMDIMMPRKSGKEAYEEIKCMKPDTKALFMSGYAADVTRKKGILDRGMNFIPKPVSPGELLRRVGELFGNYQII